MLCFFVNLVVFKNENPVIYAIDEKVKGVVI